MQPLSSYEDKELFRKIASGDEPAFAELFHRYTPKLLPFIYKLTRNEHLARELVQESFLKIWISREQLPSVLMPSAYIYRIASNIAVNWLKVQSNRQRILSQVVVPGEIRTPEEQFNAKELHLLIADVINLLPERRQEIYRLSREQGLSHQEIADQLGLSVNTVKNQIGIALKFIQERIASHTGLSMITIVLLFTV